MSSTSCWSGEALKSGKDEEWKKRRSGETSEAPRTTPRFRFPFPPFSLYPFLLLLLTGPASAQPDTTAAPADTSAVLFADTSASPARARPDPGAALRRSLLVPGWGQVYNGDYAKAGIAVAGVGALVALAVTYGLRTTRYRRAAIFDDCSNNPESVPPGTCGDFEDFRDEWVEAGSLPASANRALRDNSRRNRDFLILMSGLAYALQALDAYVSAHLASFDVSEDLSLHLAPTPSGPAAALRWSF